MDQPINETVSDVSSPNWQRLSADAPARSEEPHSERARLGLPLALFLITCYTTYRVGQAEFQQGFAYAIALMGILTAHEMGHYVQARRYHVLASLPFFIPMPIGPLGTMGAVIGMRGNMGNRKALFDIGISGPLAGLVPTLACCIVGLKLSNFVGPPFDSKESIIGAPLAV